MFMFAFLVTESMLDRTARVMTLKGCFGQRSGEAAGANGADGLGETRGSWTEVDGFRRGEGEIAWDPTGSGVGDLMGVAVSNMW